MSRLGPAFLALARAFLVLVFSALALVGCDGCDDDTTSTPTQSFTAKPPVPAPDGLAAEIVVRSPRDTIQAIREAAGGPALFLPRTVGGVAANLFGLPLQAVEVIDEQLPVVAATMLGSAGEVLAAGAVHYRDRDRLLSVLTGGPEPRFRSEDEGDITWLEPLATLREARVPAVLALVDHYLVAGSDRPAVTRLGPYLTRSMAARTPPTEDVVIDLKRGAFGERLRKRLEGLRATMDAMPLPPAMEALVDTDAMFTTGLALLDDLAGGQIKIELGEQLLEIDATLTPKDDAARARLGALPTVVPADMAKLPDDVVAAVAWTQTLDGRRHGVSQRAKAVASMFGEGWNASDTQTLSDTLDSIASARGDHNRVAVRCTGVGVTGMALGDVSDGDKLRAGLESLVDSAKHPAVAATLKASSLSLSAKKTRILEVPHDVWRVRLTPEGEGSDKRLEAIDLLYMVLDDRFVAAAGMETVDTLQQLETLAPDKLWSNKSAVKGALSRLPNKAWVAALVDPQGIHACGMGRPGGTFATPVAVAVGPQADTVAARVEIARPLIRIAVQQLGF